jgi:DNA-binding transcriptional MerR regulator
MQKFTIGDVENLTAIKAHTLRIWEQRYGFFQAQRKESRHRFYDSEDLKKLLRVAFLYHNGWRISRIASMDEPALLEEIRKSANLPNPYTSYIIRLTESALDFDEQSFSMLLEHIIQQVGFEAAVTNVCYPFLQRIGLLWSTNNVIPAQEHFTSYLIQNRIIRESEQVTKESKAQPEIILFCPRGEYHELPLLYLNYLLKKNNWGTVFLGADVEFSVIEPVAALPGIHSIYLHLITNMTGLFIDEYLEQLCRTFPGKKIIASGMALQQSQRSFANLTVLRNDQEIYRFVNREL